MTLLCLENATVLDLEAGELWEGRQVVIEEGRISAIEGGPLRTGLAELQRIDLGGRVLMPGLCDAHVHVTAVTANFAELRHMAPSYVAARAAGILRDMLMRGFTTVRDAGGCDFGLARAVEEGILVGPRILYCGHALSQTGGHGDMRGPGEQALEHCFCCAGLGTICDGVAAVRRACREEIRRGAHQIKLMVSGGVASPTDRIGNTQFALEEIRAAVEEAEAAELYVMAHAYTARAINRALDCGVRSIEHGNLLDESSVALLLEKQAFLVPTLATYRALAAEGVEAGMPAPLVAKVDEVLDAGIRALELAHRHGVKMAYGTDLLGIMHRRQLDEFAIRAEVQRPLDILRAATVNAAELFGMTGEIGVVAPGARADLLVLDGNPLEDLGVLQDPTRYLRAVLKDGVFHKNELG